MRAAPRCDLIRESIFEPVDIKSDQEELGGDFEEVTIDGISSCGFINLDDDLIDSEEEKPEIDHDTNTVKPVAEERPVFTCRPCKIFFPHRFMLDRHQRFVHNKSEPNSAKILLERLKERASGYRRTENGRYACDKCGFRTLQKSTVESHIKLIHGIVKKQFEMRTPSVTVALVSSRKRPEKRVVEEQEGLVSGDLDLMFTDETNHDEQLLKSSEENVDQDLELIDVEDNEMMEVNDHENIEDHEQELIEQDAEEELIEEHNEEELNVDHFEESEIVENLDEVDHEQIPELDEEYHDQQPEHIELVEGHNEQSEQVDLYEELVQQENLESMEIQPEIIMDNEFISEMNAQLEEVPIEVDPLPVGVPEQFEEQQEADDEESGAQETAAPQLEDEEEEGKLFTCPYCEFESPKKTVIYTHINNQHNDEWLDEAGRYASRRWLTKKRMKERLKQDFQYSDYTDKRERKHKCNFCDYAATTRSTLNCHTRNKHPGCVQPTLSSRHSRSVELQCDQCDFKTIDRHKMQVHIERKHVTECRYGCEYCGKKFKVKCDLTSHIRFQHFKTPCVCDVCGKVCSNSNSLHVHQKREHFLPEFECHICHRRVVSQANLDEHIKRQHTQKVRYVCEQCGKVFDYQAKLKQHTMTHTGEKPHTCHVCGKSFARRAVFRQHLLIHTGQRPYVCDICGKTFTQKPGLICHRKMHPGDKPPLPVVFIDHILKKYVMPDAEEEST